MIRRETKPRLCFVGSMVGRTPGHITQQGQVLSDLFARAGYPVVSVSGFLQRWRRLIDIVATLIRERRRTDVLIIEVYGGRSFVVEDIASWLGARFKIPIVLWLHGGALPEFMGRFSRWSRRVLRRANVVVTPSAFLARAIARFQVRAIIIPNVIDFASYPYRCRDEVKPQLFWMRSFENIWNPEMAVRVLARVQKRHPDATLVMAGPDKGSQAATESLATSLGLDDSLRFAGFLDMAGKIRAATESDIYINTNRIDNAPVAVIEACAMGMPVVTTEVGGIRDLLTDGETGLFVADDDDKAMAKAICELVSDANLARRLSRNGRSLAEQFSWEQVRPKWEKLFEELMEQNLVLSANPMRNHASQAKPSMMENF